MSLKKKLGIFFGIFSLVFFTFTSSPNLAFAQNEVTPLTSCTGTLEEGCYTLLEPLGGIEGVSVGNANGEGGIGGFMNFIFGIGIGVAGVLGVVMLIIYGFQYASNEQSIRGFTELKEKITSVILGLLLLLGTFILLRTINPDLLLVDPEISGVSFDLAVLGSDLDLTKPISRSDYNNAKKQYVSASKTIEDFYEPALKKQLPNTSKGIKLLLMAQTQMEGFLPPTAYPPSGSRSYRNNNPGNVFISKDEGTKFASLEMGIQAQWDYVLGPAFDYENVKNRYTKHYNKTDSLFKYISTYAPLGHGSNNPSRYTNFIIAFFKKYNHTITSNTTLLEIKAIN